MGEAKRKHEAALAALKDLSADEIIAAHNFLLTTIQAPGPGAPAMDDDEVRRLEFECRQQMQTNPNNPVPGTILRLIARVRMDAERRIIIPT